MCHNVQMGFDLSIEDFVLLFNYQLFHLIIIISF